ncbi:MAG TPA: YkvA family protein [Pirellulales bacterium]|nr:YkvA family protein [Pirellulales bacterium]
MILQLVVSVMILMCFLLGIVAAIAPWIGIIGAVRYFRQRKASEGRHLITYSEQEQQMAYRPPGPTMDAKDWLLIAGTFIYVLCPIDMVPDIPIIGWFDDAGVIAFVIKHFYDKFWKPQPPPEPPQREPEHWEAPRQSLPRHSEDDDAIDAEFEVRNLPALRQNQLVRRR